MLVAPLVALALAAPPGRAPFLERLAERAALAIARIAAGRPVEVLEPEDRIGGGAGPAVRAHLSARLGAGPPPGAPRVARVVSVLAGGPQRTRLWGRVVEEPGGRTLDVFSVAVEAPAEFPPPPPPGLGWRGPRVDAALPGPALAVALLEGERALLVASDHLSLLALGAGRATELSRHPLPAPWPVRAPGALVSCDTRAACWVTTSHMTDAVLVTTDGGRLVETARAEVLPWPDTPTGARFRAGTDLVEAAIPGLPEGPYVQVGAGSPRFAVSPAGWLGVEGRGWLPVPSGRAAAPLWPGALLLSAPVPPGASDEVRVVALPDGEARVDAPLPVAGAVRALAAAASAEGARVALVVEDHTGAFRLRVYDLERRGGSE